MADTGNSHGRQIYLLGRQTLGEFLGMITRTILDGDAVRHPELVQEWREAKRRIAALEASEAGWADAPLLDVMPPQLLERASAFLRRASVEKDLGLFPHQWRMVELDRLVVYQPSVDVEFATQLQALLPPQPTSEDVLDFVIGAGLVPPVDCARLAYNSFMFTSNSNDLRCIEVSLSNAGTQPGCAVAGCPAAWIGIAVGYSMNFLTAIQVGNRLVLANGTHRAYALRARGITHVPCVVRQVTHEDELDALEVPELRRAAVYLRSPRPPVFKDYFDPAVHKVLLLPRRKTLVQVQVSIHSSRAPA